MEKRITVSVHQQKQRASFSKRGGLIHRIARSIYRRLPDVIIYGYAFLYMYTGWAKFMNMATFIRGNSKIPYLGAYAKLIGYGIPTLEIVLAILLIVPVYRIKRSALWASNLLMGVFTLYLSLMVRFADKKLCHCGGVIESMGWKTHIVFNLIWLIAGIFALISIKVIHFKIQKNGKI
ncbi:MauE/DoxX family redox-associated membrane protein [Sphingobacterium sp. Lzh-3]|uniref:MauE/DoxX family redox-associated membrane protein n=1 Tax=Sphingobacterium sp. Lzh-3 TaxID=3382150 RepID=UPI00398CED22